MTTTMTPITVVYQEGVFIPQADVHHLREGIALNLDIPAPDEWDDLLAKLGAEADDETTGLTRGRWDAVSPDVVRWVIAGDEWLVWDLAGAKEPHSALM